MTAFAFLCLKASGTWHSDYDWAFFFMCWGFDQVTWAVLGMGYWRIRIHRRERG